MKRLSVLVMMIILLISCGPSNKSVEMSEPSQLLDIKTVEIQVTEVPFQIETTEEMTYADHRDNILAALNGMTEFETQTEIVVDATGGSFLMPRFQITVEKNLQHIERPLSTRAKVETDGPFFLDLGPSRTEVYTEDGEVYSYDEKTRKFQEADLKPSQVRQRYDVETEIQQKLWREETLELETGSRMIARLKLEGKDGRELVEDILKKYRIAFEFDKEINETIELRMEYQPDTYQPKHVMIDGTTGALGYDLSIRITVDYSNVK